MLRALAAVLLILPLAGCMGGPSELTPVEDGLTVSGEPPRSRPEAEAPDCAIATVDAGFARIARITCESGHGAVTATLDGCAAQGGSSWLSLETEEGRLASGNATATVRDAGATLASLSVNARAEDGKETMLGHRAAYTLELGLEGWTGEWVAATLECAP